MNLETIRECVCEYYKSFGEVCLLLDDVKLVVNLAWPCSKVIEGDENVVGLFHRVRLALK